MFDKYSIAICLKEMFELEITVIVTILPSYKYSSRIP